MQKFVDAKYWSEKDGLPVMKEIELIDTAYSYDEEQELLNVEDNSWWYIYRAKVIKGLCKKYFDERYTIVDIGGGNGYTTFEISKMECWSVHCWSQVPMPVLMQE